MNGGWIHISQLKEVKSLITIQEQFMFEKSSKFSKPVAKLEPGRLLLIKKCKKKWCKVFSEDTLGWIEIQNIWGKI